jgi:polyisoprenoid-binding protein YceI
MVNIIALFALFSGVVSTVAFSRNIGGSVKSISHYILGLSVLLIASDYLFLGEEHNPYFGYILISVLSVLFFIGELTKSKHGLIWNVIPLISVGALFLVPDYSALTYLNEGIDGFQEVAFIATLSAVTPFLTHLAKLGISNLIIRFGSIRWADNEDNYLESIVSYAFIGGIAALGGFLAGNAGILIAATYYTGASLIARNKLGLKNDTLLTAGTAMFVIAAYFLLLDYSGFSNLELTRGEVIEGAFIGGFTILIYDLFLLLARHNSGKWKIILTLKAIFIPLVAILALVLAYTQLERLGGMLSVAALLFSLAILSVVFSLFKDYTFIGLKLLSVGAAFVVAPFFRPFEQVSEINLEELGITATTDSNTQDTEPATLSLDESSGNWKILSESSKIFFELGPEKGRTKGEITSISGTIQLSSDINKSSINLKMPVKSLTTYIPDRDEHLMEADFFNEKKFPEMQFNSKAIELKGNYYLVQGEFTMMGVTKPLDVELRIIGKGERNGKSTLVIRGKSVLNRTDFGQKTSAKIGDIVEFNYEIVLESV